MKIIQSNWFTKLVHKLVITFFVLSLLVLLWKWRSLPPVVPLWFSRPWGSDQLAQPQWLLLLPVGSAIVYAINVAIASRRTVEYLIFTQMLFLASLIVSALSFFALIKIIFLVS